MMTRGNPVTVVNNVNSNVGGNGSSNGSSNASSGGGGNNNSSRKDTAKQLDDSEKHNSSTLDRWLGAALIAGGAAAATFVFSKTVQHSKDLSRFERQRIIVLPPSTDACYVLNCFDTWLDDTKAVNTLSKRIAVSGGATATALGSLCYFGVGNSLAYFPFILLGCASIGAAAHARVLADGLAVSSRRLHSACKRWLEQ
jgi:hypothetical protein